MKKIILIFGLIFSVQDFVYADFVSPDILAVGAETACIVDNESVKCWDHNGEWLWTPKLVSPLSVSVYEDGSYFSICAIDLEGLKCWARTKTSSTVFKFKDLVKPKFIGYGNCILDEGSVLCVEHKGYPTPARLVKQEGSFYANSRKASENCILDNEGVKCIDSDKKLIKIPPLKKPLKNPREIIAGNWHACVLDDDGVKCWFADNEKYYKNNQEIEVPNLKNPRSLFFSNFSNQMCAIDDDGLKCWISKYPKEQYDLPILKNPILIKSGSNRYGSFEQFCAIDDEGLRCWKKDRKKAIELINVPNIKSPSRVVVGEYKTCLYDDGKLKCSLSAHLPWATNLPDKLIFQNDRYCIMVNGKVSCNHMAAPKLNNPKDISYADLRGDSLCALDDSGVTCWGRPYLDMPDDNVPTFKNPKAVSGTCAIDDDGVKCWVRKNKYDYPGQNIDFGQANVPPLKNPRAISFGYDHVCALDDNGVKCWGSIPGKDNGQSNVPVLKNPRQIETTLGVSCALDDEGVKCWGSNEKGHLNVPVLKNPRHFSISSTHACALDDDGLKCWGQYDKYKDRNEETVFSMNLSQKNMNFSGLSNHVSDYLSDIKRSVTPARSSYVAMIEEYMKKDLYPLSLSQGAIGSYYFVLGLVSPVVLTMDSLEFVQSKIPLFKKDMDYLDAKLGFSNLSDALSKIEDNSRNRQIALKSIQAAVTVALEFVSIQEKAELQDLLRQIGQLIIDPSNTSQIKDLIVKLESPTSPLQKLTSPKSAFLIDVINLAKDWLKKVK